MLDVLETEILRSAQNDNDKDFFNSLRRAHSSVDKRGFGKNRLPQPRFLVVKSSYIVIASDPALAGERGNLTQSVILSKAKNLVEILRALPSG